MATHLAVILLHACLCGASLASALSPLISWVSFSLVHRDASFSVLRNKELERGIPEGLPLRYWIIGGRGIRERSYMRGLHQRQHHSSAANAEVAAARFSYEQGVIYLTASMGTPPQKIVFLVDTGSELTYTECKPCIVCAAKGGPPPFDYTKSSTYKKVPCSSPVCSESLGLRSSCANSTAGPCVFQLAYGDNSSEQGSLGLDTFHMGKEAVLRRPLVFGCATINRNSVPTVDSGLIGLNNGPYSFSSQLLQAFSQKKFAYCLPNLEYSGTLLFGSYAAPTRFHYTPMEPPYSPIGSLYYYVRVTGISVGTKSLGVKMSLLASNEYGGGGTIFDSGTSITRFVDPVYDAVVTEMREQTRRMKPFASIGLDEDLCYNVSARAADVPRVPTVTLHLAGGVDMEWDYRSLLYGAYANHDVVVSCLALARTPPKVSSDVNIIGSYQQQNHWIEYDLQFSRIGIAKARRCA